MRSWSKKKKGRAHHVEIIGIDVLRNPTGVNLTMHALSQT